MSNPKKRRVDKSNDPEVWIRWFNELSSGEESPIEDESEDDVGVEVDVAQKSDLESESELEALDQDEKTSPDDLDEMRPSTFYLGKDKVTK